MYLLSNFPNEILIKIFNDCKVMPLTLVSKRFNDIISNSPLLMRKVQLVITEKSLASEIIKSERKYQNVLIKFNYKVGKEVLDIIKRFGNDIKHLELIRCIVTENVFLNILKSVPNIEVLTIITTFIKIDFSQELEVPALSKLKKFVLRNSDFNFLDYLMNSKSIKCINVAFVRNQPVEEIMIFLQQHPEIEEIENLMISPIKSTLMTEVMNFKNLKKLSLEVDKLDLEHGLDIENHSVEYLNLYGNAESPEDLNTILKIFKGLTSLEIEMNSSLEPNNMTQINSMNLISLNLKQCLGEFFNDIQMRSLKHFYINDALSITHGQWIQFANRNPNIEVLKIKDESIANDTFIAITQNFRNLHHFELFFDPQRLTSNILNFICDHNFPKNIKILKITERIPQPNERRFNLTHEQRENLKHRNGFKLLLC